MATKNDVTGDSLKTKAPSKKYDEGWERIFGKKQVEEAIEKGIQDVMHPAHTRYPHLKKEK